MTSAPDLSRSPLLERDLELGLFKELLSKSGAAAERLVIVEGPAGIGKSRLLTRDLGLARRPPHRDRGLGL